jgi:hypothetical protein
MVGHIQAAVNKKNEKLVNLSAIWLPAGNQGTDGKKTARTEADGRIITAFPADKRAGIKQEGSTLR